VADQELDVIVAQLDELLRQGAVDEEEALEIAALAGMAERMGAAPSVLAEAIVWRDQRGGGALLDEAWGEVDIDAYVDAIEACLDGDVSDDDVADAVYDLDELVAAAAWCGRGDVVRKATIDIERMIRVVPDPFVSLSADAAALARSPAVAGALDLYGFWLAIADAAAASGEV
jgi:hypothetical protein